MNVTWKDFFTIVKNTWGLSDNKIAERLGCSRSTIGHILSGKTKSLRLDNLDIYRGLFDLTKDTPAAKGGEKHTFDELKISIENEGLDEATKSLNPDDYAGFVMGLLRLARQSEPSENELRFTKTKLPTEPSPVQYESALKDFERVISEHRFLEFIESEPLKFFTTTPELNAEDLESYFAEYVDSLDENAKSLLGDPSDIGELLFGDYADDDSDEDSKDDPQDKYFPYTDKFLTPTLLNINKQLVSIFTEILPTLEATSHPANVKILKFRDNLKSYNEYLNKNLTAKNEYFIYNYSFEDYEKKEDDERVTKEKDAIDVMAELLGKSVEDIEIIPIDGDDKSELMSFHSSTRHLRAAINSLYDEIQDEIRHLLNS